MNCPKCQNYNLKQVETISGSGASPHTCVKCGGIWVENENIENIADICQTIDQQSSDTASTQDFDKQTGMCPAGHGLLIRAKVDAEDPFYLERCTACGGIWFDKGEWQRVAEKELLHHIQEFWTYAWQREQQKKRSADAYHDMIKNIFGDALYKSMTGLSSQLKTHPEKIMAVAFLRNEILND